MLQSIFCKENVREGYKDYKLHEHKQQLMTVILLKRNSSIPPTTLLFSALLTGWRSSPKSIFKIISDIPTRNYKLKGRSHAASETATRIFRNSDSTWIMKHLSNFFFILDFFASKPFSTYMSFFAYFFSATSCYRHNVRRNWNFWLLFLCHFCEISSLAVAICLLSLAEDVGYMQSVYG